MSDDRIASESTREMFEAIVSQLDDPEVVRMRMIVLVLGAAIFVTAIAVTVSAGLGWQLLLAFCSTYVPGVLVVLRIVERRLRPLSRSDQ